MRVVLNHTLVLAENLTWEQSNSLIQQIRERAKTSAFFEGGIYMESTNQMLWRVTVHMPYAKDFVEDPHAFIFEV